ncbi:hypothetical protein MAPG_04480 [Magnaporthiopsis poae ATCC 64411]|uniref:2-deoxy-D-gluconate 3-dehydrogenase n=1 Tax=Magnaporthiopsis poae (strain ATCC 64411 / 73-15) TaxID=644358 RepID=A0A0C4DWU7_MAGP6|nr:hypothetical protein MAPG_04480 [Magnaporthiopsis poae ATCC 64411]
MPNPFLEKLFALDGRVAVVTGGTRGIGQAMAVALAEAGADIISIQRDESNLETKKQVEALGRKATVYTCDLSCQEAVEKLAGRVLGDGHDVSILVTCGGIQRRHPAHVFPIYHTPDMNEALLKDEARAASILARIPAGRWGNADDFKGVTVFLAGRGSLYVSGEVLTVDGGWMGR